MDVFFMFCLTMQVPLQEPDVAEMLMCVTFGAPRFGFKFRTICARSEYATFLFHNLGDCCARNGSVRNVWRASFWFPGSDLEAPSR